MSAKKKQFCPKNHNTFIIGRTSEGTCKSCDVISRKKWKLNNPDKVASYYEPTPEELEARKIARSAKAIRRQQLEECRASEEGKAEVAAYQKDYYEKNKEKLSASSKIRYKENRDTKLSYQKEYGKVNRSKITAHNRARKKTDPLFKLSKTLSNRICNALNRQSWTKGSTTRNIVGCSLPELKLHIEKQFQPGMTWDNHTFDGWHIDHIIPLASATTEAELYKLCHYTNLQPLWAPDNFRKSNKMPGSYAV